MSRLRRGERVMVEANLIADNGANAVTVQLRGAAGEAAPPMLVGRRGMRRPGPGFVLVEGIVFADLGVGAVLIEFLTPAGQAHPPFAAWRESVHSIESGGGFEG